MNTLYSGDWNAICWTQDCSDVEGLRVKAEDSFVYFLTVICCIGYIYFMTNSFALLADPTRRQLLDELRRGECSVGALVERVKMSQPAVSKQLRVLREAGLASVRVDAQRRIYRLNAEGLRDVDEWLAPYRAFWEERLDAMEQTLDSMEE